MAQIVYEARDGDAKNVLLVNQLRQNIRCVENIVLDRSFALHAMAQTCRIEGSEHNLTTIFLAK